MACKDCLDKHWGPPLGPYEAERKGDLFTRQVTLFAPRATFWINYEDEPKACYIADLTEFFLCNCWCIVSKYAPRELWDLERKWIFFGIKAPRLKKGNPNAVGSFFVPREEGLEEYYAILICDIIEMYPDYDERGHVFVIGHTIVHELLHPFYKSEETVENKLVEFNNALREWVDSKKFPGTLANWRGYISRERKGESSG